MWDLRQTPHLAEKSIPSSIWPCGWITHGWRDTPENDSHEQLEMTAQFRWRSCEEGMVLRWCACRSPGRRWKMLAKLQVQLELSCRRAATAIPLVFWLDSTWFAGSPNALIMLICWCWFCTFPLCFIDRSWSVYSVCMSNHIDVLHWACSSSLPCTSIEKHKDVA